MDTKVLYSGKKVLIGSLNGVERGFSNEQNHRGKSNSTGHEARKGLP